MSYERERALREALETALDQWEYNASYKSDFLVKKHGDREEIAELRKLLETMPNSSESPESSRDVDTHQMQADLAGVVNAWLEPRKDRVAYVRTVHRSSVRVHVFIVQAGVACDIEMQDAATELDLAIAHDPRFAKLQVDVLVLPRVYVEAAERFAGVMV